MDTSDTGSTMDKYHLGHNRMPIGLRFAFFKFHLRNVYFTWYYNRRNRSTYEKVTQGWKI